MRVFFRGFWRCEKNSRMCTPCCSGAVLFGQKCSAWPTERAFIRSVPCVFVAHAFLETQLSVSFLEGVEIQYIQRFSTISYREDFDDE